MRAFDRPTRADRPWLLLAAIAPLLCLTPPAKAGVLTIGTSAGTNEMSCTNGFSGQSGPERLCSFGGGGQLIGYAVGFVNDDPFGGSATASAYGNNGFAIPPENLKIGGTASAQGPSVDYIDTRASFGVQVQDTFRLGGGPDSVNLPGRVVYRLRLDGDVVIPIGSVARGYSFTFDGGPAELEASYTADNTGVFGTFRPGVDIIVNGGVLTLEISVTLDNFAAIAELVEQEFTVGLEGWVIAQQGQSVNLDLGNTLQFESIAIYTLDGALYPGLTLESTSGYLYPFLNNVGGTPSPGSVPEPASVLLLGLALASLASRRRRP